MGLRLRSESLNYDLGRRIIPTLVKPYRIANRKCENRDITMLIDISQRVARNHLCQHLGFRATRDTAM